VGGWTNVTDLAAGLRRQGQGGELNEAELEMGPVDYVVIEWSGEPSGEGAEELVALAEQGIVRVLDLAFLRKADNGEVRDVDLSEVTEQVPALAVFEGASSGLLSETDLKAAADAIDAGKAAIVIVYENRWAAPFAGAVRRGGGELVASGRITAQELMEAIEASPA
jgi:hypothetical protein